MLGAMLVFASLGLVSCDVVTCALSANAEQCWAENTGVLRTDGVRERWTGAEIVAGQSPLVHIMGDVAIYGDNWDSNPTDGKINFSNYWVDGCIGVHADNVTINNVLVRSDHMCAGGDYGGAAGLISTGFHEDRPDGSGVKNLVIYDTEIDGMDVEVDNAGIGQADWSAFNVNIHSVVKGVRMDNNNRLQESYIHDLKYSPLPPAGLDIHGEGVFFAGGPGNLEGGPANIVIDHNWIASTGSTGAIAFLNNYDGSYATVNNNYLNGNGGAGFAGGAYTHKSGEYFHHISFTNNVIDVASHPEATAFCNTCTGNVWTSNVDSLGNPVAAPGPSSS